MVSHTQKKVCEGAIKPIHLRALLGCSELSFGAISGRTKVCIPPWQPASFQYSY